MKNKKVLSIIAAFILVIGLFCLPVFAEEDTATISVMIGTVEYLASETTAWVPATEGMKLSGGDKVRTGIDGMLSIVFTNGSIVTLKQDTEFQIQSLQLAANKKDVDCRLQLTRGTLRAAIEKLGDDSSFEIQTPTAVAAVRGTILYLIVKEVAESDLPPGVLERLTTELFVEEGGVIYTNTLSGKFYSVTGGESSESSGDGGITVPIEVPDDKKQEWIQGWDDILAAEPYQEDGGADPDLGGGADGDGEDLEGERTSNQLRRILLQDERDIVWQEMVRKLIEREFLRAQVRSILEANQERRVEGYIEKISDAQTGKVLTDIHGNRVRVEQYVLRPDNANNVVELLNVNLRGGVVGGDLTTMQWTTTFSQSLDTVPTGQLKALPWNDYLNTVQSNLIGPYIMSAPPENMFPQAMAVSFSHNNDGFTESRTFHDPEFKAIMSGFSPLLWVQDINDEQLTVSNFNAGLPMNLASVGSPQTAGTFSIQPGLQNADIGAATNNPMGFQYKFASAAGQQGTIDATFYILSNNGIDSIRQDGYGSLSINNVWDALRVNMPGGDKQIGDNNLEMRFISSGTVFASPIDLIYVPFHSMDWKEDSNIPEYSLP